MKTKSFTRRLMAALEAARLAPSSALRGTPDLRELHAADLETGTKFRSEAEDRVYEHHVDGHNAERSHVVGRLSTHPGGLRRDQGWKERTNSPYDRT